MRKILFNALFVFFLLMPSAFAANFYASNQVIQVSTTGNVITLTGSGTSWTGSPFTVSGGTSPSITSQTVNSTTSASITVSAGSATGALTISDGSASTSIYVEVPQWSQIITDSFTRANTSVGAAGTTTGAGNNWTDLRGSTWNINSNTLIGDTDSINTGFNSQIAQRQSSENSLDGRILLSTTLASGVSQGAYLRQTGSSGTVTGYLAQVSGSGATDSLYSIVGGSATALANNTGLGANAGHQYQIDFSAWGVNPTNLLFILTDLTACKVVNIINTTNATASNQTIGAFGINISGTGSSTLASFQSATTYNNIASATAYTLAGPSFSSIGVASSNFTATSNGILASDVTVTPSDGAVGGAFTPTTITLSAGLDTSATFTYTPTAATTITATNNGGLTNPAGLIFSVPNSVTDPNMFFSPYNWYSNGSGSPQANNILPSSSFAQTVNPGAYIKMGFTGTSVKLVVDPSALVSGSVSANQYPTIYWTIDNTTAGTHLVTSSDSIVTLQTSLASATHQLRLWFRSTGAANSVDRWNTPTNVLKVSGILIDAGASSVAPPVKPCNEISLGDSITEGALVLSNTGVGTTDSDATQTYSTIAANALDCEFGNVGFASQGLRVAIGVVNGNVPMLYNATDSLQSWNKYYSGASRLFSGLLSPAPDYIFINEGTNDFHYEVNTSTFTSAVTSLNGALRAAAPNARVFWILPFGGYYSSYIVNGVSAAFDINTYIIDVGVPILGLDSYSTGASWLSLDGVHPSARGHALFGAQVAQQVQYNSGSSSNNGAGIVVRKIKIGR